MPESTSLRQLDPPMHRGTRQRETFLWPLHETSLYTRRVCSGALLATSRDRLHASYLNSARIGCASHQIASKLNCKIQTQRLRVSVLFWEFDSVYCVIPCRLVPEWVPYTSDMLGDLRDKSLSNLDVGKNYFCYFCYSSFSQSSPISFCSYPHTFKLDVWGLVFSCF